MTLRVLVVSDIGVVREGLHSVLARHDEVDVVGSTDLLHAKNESEQLHPDVVLFDAGRQGSVDLVKEIVASAPRAKVVAFGVKETDDEILALAAAGTAGYIRDNVRSGDIVRVLERVMSDELTCSPRAAASLYRRVGTLSRHSNVSVGSDNPPADTMPLSRRELQIARLVDCGLTNKEIARQLGIEAATVKNHIHNICQKLNVHRRGEATARIRASLSRGAPMRVSGDMPMRAPAPDSLPAPKRAADQKPAARNGNHVGHPWDAGAAQLGGVAIASAPSEAKSPIAKF
jgi:two-component system, NarL family, nitrate/nitrite response regulator NarL